MTTTITLESPLLTEATPNPILDLSLVIPVHNEARNLPILCEEITATLVAQDYTYEVIVIDDGSNDDTWATLQMLATADDHLVLAQHRRRCGKSAGLRSGFSLARGAVIVTLDGDLQDDPQEIPGFLEQLAAGDDLVSGWKYPRYDPWHKTLPSLVFNSMMRLLFRLPLHDFNCGFKAYRREVVDDLELYGELHRFIPVFAAANGYQVGERQVHHRPRRWGHSKYGLERLLRGFFDALSVFFLTRYPERPLHLFGLIGLFCAVSGGVICAWLSAEWLLGETKLSQRPLLLLGVLLVILSAQFISIGLLGDLIISRSGIGRQPVERNLRQVVRHARDGRL
jgi:glycosyltransferase involved in cell wall biosynthesis